MPTFTKKLNLRKPEETDYYNERTEQAENWQKIDDYAEQIDSDKLDRGGYEGTGLDLNNLILGNTGITQVMNIEDLGTKIKGNIYWDNSVIPKIPYLCLNSTLDITPTSNFIAADNRSLAEHNVYEYIDFSNAHANLNKASLEVYGKLCVLSAEILTGTANTLVLGDVIPAGYGSRIQVRVGGVSRDANPKGVSVDIQGRSMQIISYGQNPYVIYTTASWIRV